MNDLELEPVEDTVDVPTVVYDPAGRPISFHNLSRAEIVEECRAHGTGGIFNRPMTPAEYLRSRGLA